MSANLTKSDVLKVTGLNSKKFDDWCKKGVIYGVKNGGRGQGNHRQFSREQAIAIAIGVSLQNTVQGCHPCYVRSIMNAFDRLGAVRLDQLLDSGKTHLMCITADGLPELDSPPVFPEYPDIDPDDHWPNVAAIKKAVVCRINALEEKPASRRNPGRTTGLK